MNKISLTALSFSVVILGSCATYKKANDKIKQANNRLKSSLAKLNEPLDDSFGFDPLSAPGARRFKQQAAVDVDVIPEGGIQIGSYAEANVPNTKFFSKLSKSNYKADRVLAQGAALQIIGATGDFYKVRLVNNGLEGFVPKVMITDKAVLPTVEPEDAAAIAAAGVVNSDLPLLPDGNVEEPIEPELPLDPSEDPDGDGIVKDEPVVGGGIVKDEPTADTPKLPEIPTDPKSKESP